MISSSDILHGEIQIVDDLEANVLLLERMRRGVSYRNRLAGVRSRYDRNMITGILPGTCDAGGMTSFLDSRSIRIFGWVGGSALARWPPSAARNGTRHPDTKGTSTLLNNALLGAHYARLRMRSCADGQ